VAQNLHIGLQIVRPEPYSCPAVTNKTIMQQNQIKSSHHTHNFYSPQTGSKATIN